MTHKRALGGTIGLATIAILLSANRTYLPSVVATEANAAPHKRAGIDLGLLAETLDAINAELALSGRIKGRAEINVAVECQSNDSRILDLVYRVPGIVQIYREAYVQDDGTVLLADSLDFANWDRRSSMHPIDDNKFNALYLAYDARIESMVGNVISATAKDRQIVRAKRKLRAMQAP